MLLNMDKPYIYLDCDEVLLQTAVTHALFLRQTYNLEVNMNAYPSQWDFSPVKNLDFKKSTFLFTQSEYFSNLPAIDGAQEAVRVLKKQGYSLAVVSSISDSPAVQHARFANLHHVFGPVFDDIKLLPLGWANKSTYYKSVRKGIAIDDSIFNVQDAIACGHKAVFITIPQNKDHISIAIQSNIPMASSLLEWATTRNSRRAR